MTPYPDHAYLPGRTPRHADGAFDGLKTVTHPLRDSPAWEHGLHLLRARFYWEAHEVLEAVWMAAPERSGQKAAVQGVIQIANAALKARMGQARAAARLVALARDLLAEAERLGGMTAMGLGPEELAALWAKVAGESGSDCAL